MNRDALVIGIDRYPLLRNSRTRDCQHLTAAARDAEAVARLLETYGNFRVKRFPESLIDGKLQVDPMKLVRAAELEDAINYLFNPEGERIPDVALLFFAGHGFRKKPTGNNLQGYLGTSDTNDRQEFWGVSLKRVQDILRKSPVKGQIIFLDSCYSGELFNFAPEIFSDDKVRFFVSATREFEAAHSKPNEHGALTEIILAGLDPSQDVQGIVTSDSLAKYIQNRKCQFSQKPQLHHNNKQRILLTAIEEKKACLEPPLSSLEVAAENKGEFRMYLHQLSAKKKFLFLSSSILMFAITLYFYSTVAFKFREQRLATNWKVITNTHKSGDYQKRNKALEALVKDDAEIKDKIDLSEANLQRLFLKRAQLQQAKLKGADLRGANLEDAFFYEANLKGAHFGKAFLWGVRFKGVNLQNADLQEVNLQGANLGGIDFQGANFWRSFLWGCDLQDAILQNVNLSEVNLDKAILIGANLQRANLRKSFLHSANLSNTKLQQADLSEVNLDKARLNGANLSNANLRKSFLHSANLSNANLQETNLSEVNLDTAILKAANLQRANLSGANLSNANLQLADLQEVDLKKANLQKTDLQNTNLKKAKNMVVDQVKAAKNWQLAKYDSDFRKQLGLPPETSITDKQN